MVFGKREEDSESDNWNVAKGYTNDITLEHIRDLRKFERIARFGIIEFEDQYFIGYDVKIDARLNGLIWYADELSALIADNIFAIKPALKDDKTKIKSFMDKIVILKESMEYAKVETTQRDKKVISINELIFGKILDFLIQIKIETLEVLNKSDLIFKGIDDYDPEKIKDELLRELTETG